MKPGNQGTDIKTRVSVTGTVQTVFIHEDMLSLNLITADVSRHVQGPPWHEHSHA